MTVVFLLSPLLPPPLLSFQKKHSNVKQVGGVQYSLIRKLERLKEKMHFFVAFYQYCAAGVTSLYRLGIGCESEKAECQKVDTPGVLAQSLLLLFWARNLPVQVVIAILLTSFINIAQLFQIFGLKMNLSKFLCWSSNSAATIYQPLFYVLSARRDACYFHSFDMDCL